MKEGWEIKTLKEIGKTQTGSTPPMSHKEYYNEDYMPFVKPSEINYDGLGNINYATQMLSKQGAAVGRVFEPYSIFMVCIGASIGKIGISDRAISCNQQINILTPTDKYIRKFIYYAMRSPKFTNTVIKEGLSATATLPIINKSKWENLSIFIPPLAEQRKIVDFLDTQFRNIDALKNNAEQQLQAAKDLFQSALASLLTPQNNWETKTLGEIGNFKRGGSFTKSDFVSSGIPCIHYGQIHMKFGVKTEKNISFLPQSCEAKAKFAEKGDLIIAITSEDNEGSCKCTAWMGDEKVAVGGHIAVYHHSLDPQFVSYYFRSPKFQKDKLDFVHGFKVVEIKPSDIAKISITYPKTRDEQAYIVKELDTLSGKVQSLQDNYTQTLTLCNDLKQALLKQIFD